MKIQTASIYNISFGFRPFIKKPELVNDVIRKAVKPIEQATAAEKKQLSRALGLTPDNLRNWQTKFESHDKDIIEGEILPNISVTAKGISPMEAIGNIVNVELARIRGQLKKVSIENLNL